MPDQARAYKVGMLKMPELRERARQQLGSRHNLRDCHDVVLTSGALPPEILEQAAKKEAAWKGS